MYAERMLRYYQISAALVCSFVLLSCLHRKAGVHSHEEGASEISESSRLTTSQYENTHGWEHSYEVEGSACSDEAEGYEAACDVPSPAGSSARRRRRAHHVGEVTDPWSSGGGVEHAYGRGSGAGFSPSAPAAVRAPAAAGEEEIDELAKVDATVNRMRKGNTAFSHPERMLIGSEGISRLLVSPEVPAKVLASALKETGQKVHTGEQVSLAPRMRADLTGAGFSIERSTPEEQVVTSRPTEWSWVISPKRGGEQRLHLVLSAHIMISGKDTPYVVKTFERTVVVEVRKTDQLMSFFYANWQWLLTTLIPLGVWYWKKRYPESDESTS